jgi:GTP-binding protein LepA
MRRECIRNFVIIAHIDAGKSTLADRFLELTGTVPARKMRPQYLDRMELERERGITIKMAPVRMLWRLPSTNSESFTNKRIRKFETDSLFADEYILNLIDTPGHSDFSYEVSRALAAVEGAILLVDATKGIQAQTLSNFRVAKKAGLTIIGAVNKVDMLQSRTNADSTRTDAELRLEKVIQSVAELLGRSTEEIYRISAKTGEGVAELLEAVIEEIPPPIVRVSPRESQRESAMPSGALIFDSFYDEHKGIIAFIRNFVGAFRAGDEVSFLRTNARTKLKEVGYFVPEFQAGDAIGESEIGYLATGLKEPSLVRIGDTVLAAELRGLDADRRGSSQRVSALALPGYKEPVPVVFISFYPDGGTKFEELKIGLARLRLTDAALSIEPEANEALGRGLKVGFLGQLHFDITASRLRDEFKLEFVTSFPTVAYRVREGGREYVVREPSEFPDKVDEVFQPMIALEILSPATYLNAVVNLKNIFTLAVGEIKTAGDNVIVNAKMPLAELLRDFDDKLKSVSQGYASFSYERAGEEKGEVAKLEILVAGETIPALTRIVLEKDLEREARQTVEKLKELLPRQQFAQAIQAKAHGRIIARETIPALKKDVTGYLYGGDRTRKMKLWKKQQRGKEKLKGMARVQVSVEVFRKILKK